MTTPTAGYKGKVSVSADSAGAPGAYHDVVGQAKVSMNPKNMTDDITQLNQTAGYVMRMLTLTDCDASIEYIRDTTDTNGQEVIRAAAFNKTRIWVQVWMDATHHLDGSFYVTEYPFAPDAAKAERIAVKLTFDGSPTNPLTYT